MKPEHHDLIVDALAAAAHAWAIGRVDRAEQLTATVFDSLAGAGVTFIDLDERNDREANR